MKYEQIKQNKIVIHTTKKQKKKKKGGREFRARSNLRDRSKQGEREREETDAWLVCSYPLVLGR